MAIKQNEQVTRQSLIEELDIVVVPTQRVGLLGKSERGTSVTVTVGGSATVTITASYPA